MAKTGKAPHRIKVTPATELWYKEQMAGMVGALNAMIAEVTRLQQRVVEGAGKRDKVDARRYGIDLATMEWVELPPT